MKVKEVSRTANVAWSPQRMQAIHLACGTVAQQLDATFSTNAKLEIFSLDLATPGPDMSLVGSIETPHRFHKLVWSEYGMSDSHPRGLIVGGSDNGVITIWSADRIINSGADAIVTNIDQHTGSVRSLDINPFQPNLLASGAGESEVYIWDLNNPSTPMSPGSKTHPLEDTSGVAWNCQVQHILASTSPGGRSVVWDLRKNEPIIQVADSNSRVQCSGIAWHPDIATQLVTSSVNDHSPVIQLWDLRFATSPMRILEQHTRGVLSVAWCRQDPDLLLSASKDNRVLCWNPNSEVTGGEVVYELPATSQWIFECHWCPRNPSIISTASFDGHVTMYSLLGGGGTENKGADPTQAQVAPPPSSGDFFNDLSSSVASRNRVVETAPLKTPPKWFRRPCGASFAFGGKLVSFTGSRGAGVPKTVAISRVVTEQEFLHKSGHLEDSLLEGNFGAFCESKVSETSDVTEKSMWSFLKVTFEDNPRRQYLKLLGYDIEELEKKFSTWSKMSVSTLPAAGGLDVNELSHKLSTIPAPLTEQEGDEEEEAQMTNSDTSSTAAMFGSEIDPRNNVFDSISLNDAGSSSRASKRISNASFLGISSTPPSSVSSTISIPTDRDADGMLAQALLVGNFESAVDICISADRMAEAMVLAVAGGSDLLKRTQQVFFAKKPSKVSKLIAAVVSRNWTEVARYGDLDNWREILAALVTYAGPEDFAPLCDLLGNRLEKEMDGKFRCNASLCYICSGNVEKFVESLSDPLEVAPQAGCSPLTLQKTMEKVVLLRKAVEQQRKQCEPSATLSCRLRQYAALLASQGSLDTAYSYIMQDQDSASCVLKDRLYWAQGLTSAPCPEPPFTPVNIQPPSNPLAYKGEVSTSQPSASVTNPVDKSTTSPYAKGRAAPMRGGVGGVGVGGGGGGGITGYANPMGSQSSFVGQEPIPPAPRQPTSVSNPSIFNPLAPGPAPMVSEATPMAPPNRKLNNMAWNDPPSVTNNKVAPPSPIPTPNMAPITAPIMTPLAPEPHPHAPPSMGDNMGRPSPSPAQRAPPPVVEKPPIPQEYLAMVQAFEAMLTRCRGVASNMGTRKKLDDIEKKLAILFDLLRASKVSANVAQGLNYMAQSANNRDYQSGLGCYNQLVSSVNFSEISSFMPGIKTLLNLGNQLRV